MNKSLKYLGLNKTLSKKFVASLLYSLPVELIVVVRVACLDVLLTTVKDGFGRQELSKDATDGPNI